LWVCVLKCVCFVVFFILVLFLVVSIFVNSVFLWRVWSFLGDEEFYVAFSLLVYYLHPDSARVLLVVLSVVFSGSLNVSLKYWLQLPRPLDSLVPVEGPGFPSGHSQVSASFWFTLPGVLGARCFYLISSVFVTGISLSRLYLRAHYPVDVAGGVILGLLVSIVVMCSKRVLGYLGVVMSAVFSLVLSLIAVFLLNAPISVCSILIATSLAVLLVLLLFRGCLKTTTLSTFSRLLLFIVSSTIVFTVHVLTRGFDLVVRILILSPAIFLALILPVVVSVFCAIRAR